jgi:hypothetical protein
MVRCPLRARTTTSGRRPTRARRSCPRLFRSARRAARRLPGRLLRRPRRAAPGRNWASAPSPQAATAVPAGPRAPHDFSARTHPTKEVSTKRTPGLIVRRRRRPAPRPPGGPAALRRPRGRARPDPRGGALPRRPGRRPAAARRVRRAHRGARAPARDPHGGRARLTARSRPGGPGDLGCRRRVGPAVDARGGLRRLPPQVRGVPGATRRIRAILRRPTRATREACAAWARWRSTEVGSRPASPERGSSYPASSSRSSATCRASHCASLQRVSCSATCATRPTPQRGRATRTLAPRAAARKLDQLIRSAR